MSEQESTTAHTIEFHRKGWANSRYPYAIATTRTDDPNAPVEIIRPYSDGSGNEVLVSLSADEWGELIRFVEVYGKVPRSGAGTVIPHG